MASEPRIAWKNAKYSSMVGSVGSLHLFTINYSTVRNSEPWKLRAELPGLMCTEWGGLAKEGLKAMAEDLLEQFVARLGAKFEAEVPDVRS